MSYLKDREIWLSNVPTGNPPAGYFWKFIQNGKVVVRDSSGNNQIMVATSGSQAITGSLTVTEGITGTVSSASYVEYSNVANKPTLISGSSQITGFGIFATTGSNTFQANQVITGSLFITQNLVVAGSSSIQYISSSVLDIADNIITVNAFNPGVRFGGLAVIDSGSSPQVSGSLLFDSIRDQWIFVHQNQSVVTSSVVLMGPETYNDLGNESYISTNRLPKGSGVEHLRDSNISDTGTVVSVNSNTQVTGSLTVAGSSSLFNASNTLSSDILTVKGGGASGSFGFKVEAANGEDIFYTNNFTYDVITNPVSGKFGIGTTDPQSIFHIGRSAPSNAGVKPYTGLSSTHEGFLFDYYYNTSASNVRIFDIAALGFAVNGAGGSELRFLTVPQTTINTPLERMRITAAGNVGIGTASPGEKLDVVGGGLAAGNGTIKTGITYSSLGLMGTFTNHDLGLLTNGSTKMTITSGGNVGIGTTSPTTFSGNTTLAINNAAGGAVLELQSNGTSALRMATSTSDSALWEPRSVPVLFATANTERMRITSGGLVSMTVDDSGTNTLVDVLTLTHTTSGTATNGLGAGILLQSERPSGGITLKRAAIYGVAGTDANDDGDMVFYTLTDTGPSGFTEKMRITSGGQVGIKIAPNSGWGTAMAALQIGTGGVIDNWTGSDSSMSVGVNYYDNGSGSQLRLYAKGVSKIGFDQNIITFSNAASSSAGSTITWAERMRITDGGKVIINDTSMDGLLGINTKSSTAYNPNSYNGNDANIRLSNGSAGSGRYTGIAFGGGGATEGFFGVVQNSSNLAEFVWQTYNGSAYGERMRMTSGGQVLFGTASSTGITTGTSANQGVGIGGGVLEIQTNNNSNIYLSKATGYTSSDFTAHFVNGNYVGGISTNGSATNYATASDYRLKQDLKDFDGITLINKIKTYDYEWKVDNTRMFGVIAHELQEVLPFAVTGEKDAERMQGVDYSKLIPVLVKAIQEQQTLIESLKSRIEILEQ